jgi:hypothetical protein
LSDGFIVRISQCGMREKKKTIFSTFANSLSLVSHIIFFCWGSHFNFCYWTAQIVSESVASADLTFISRWYELKRHKDCDKAPNRARQEWAVLCNIEMKSYEGEKNYWVSLDCLLPAYVSREGEKTTFFNSNIVVKIFPYSLWHYTAVREFLCVCNEFFSSW